MSNNLSMQTILYIIAKSYLLHSFIMLVYLFSLFGEGKKLDFFIPNAVSLAASL